MTLTTRGSRLFSVDPFEVFARPGDAGFGVDVREDADRLYVEADLPGFKKEQVEIVLDKAVLTITAKPVEDAVAEPETPKTSAVPAKWLLRERQARSYQRAFRLPASADGASVDAKLEDGVLRLTLTKCEETKPRKIAVS